MLPSLLLQRLSVDADSPSRLQSRSRSLPHRLVLHQVRLSALLSSTPLLTRSLPFCSTAYMFSACVAAIIAGSLAKLTNRYKWIGIAGVLIHVLGVYLMMRSRDLNGSTFDLVVSQITGGIGGGFTTIALQIGCQSVVTHQGAFLHFSPRGQCPLFFSSLGYANVRPILVVTAQTSQSPPPSSSPSPKSAAQWAVPSPAPSGRQSSPPVSKRTSTPQPTSTSPRSSPPSPTPSPSLSAPPFEPQSTRRTWTCSGCSTGLHSACSYRRCWRCAR